MDEPIFDAMLKNALQEALEEDLRQMEDPPRLHLSLRHRWRMRRMLADPLALCKAPAGGGAPTADSPQTDAAPALGAGRSDRGAAGGYGCRVRHPGR